MNTPSRKTLRAAIRGSIPDGKLHNARIVLADSRNERIAGMTLHDSQDGHCTLIGAPSGNTAKESVIRGHEARHVTFDHEVKRSKTKAAVSEQADQIRNIIEDCRIEQKPLPAVRPESLTDYCRKHLATALMEIRVMKQCQRALKKGTNRRSPQEEANYNIIFATRLAALVKAYGRHVSAKGTGLSAPYKVLSRLRSIIGAPTLNAVKQIADEARSAKNHHMAIEHLTSLLEINSDEQDEMPRPPMVKVELPACDPLNLVVQHGTTEVSGGMKIIDLAPKTLRTTKEKTISLQYAPDGPRLNVSRLIQARITGDSNGLFSRRVRRKAGGTVVIDASGSMGATAENLGELCSHIPTATVAYYSGDDCGGQGQLAIYAKAGMKFNGELPEATLTGGNSVDLEAIRWMRTQPKPWIFVSDLGFCGGPVGSESIALAMIDTMKRRGEVTVIHSLDAALDHFGSKAPHGEESERRRKRGERVAKIRASISEHEAMKLT